MHRTQADSFETQNRSNNWARLRKGKKTPQVPAQFQLKAPTLPPPPPPPLPEV